MSTEEEQIVDELDHEFSQNGSLIALIVCFGLGGWMVMVAAVNVLSTA